MIRTRCSPWPARAQHWGEGVAAQQLPRSSGRPAGRRRGDQRPSCMPRDLPPPFMAPVGRGDAEQGARRAVGRSLSTHSRAAARATPRPARPDGCSHRTPADDAWLLAGRGKVAARGLPSASVCGATPCAEPWRRSSRCTLNPKKRDARMFQGCSQAMPRPTPLSTRR